MSCIIPKVNYLRVYLLGLPPGSDGKASAYNAGDLGSIPGSGRSSGEGNGNPLQYSAGKSYGWRRVIGYSPWGPKESDMTERFHFTYLFLKCSLRNNTVHIEIMSGNVSYVNLTINK